MHPLEQSAPKSAARTENAAGNRASQTSRANSSGSPKSKDVRTPLFDADKAGLAATWRMMGPFRNFERLVSRYGKAQHAVTLQILAMLLASISFGAEPPSLRGNIAASGKPSLSVTSPEEHYLLLRGGSNVDHIERVLRAKMPTLPETTFETEYLGAGQSFYRIQAIPFSAPNDSDHDGIDDLYELQHDSFLDPLNPLGRVFKP